MVQHTHYSIVQRERAHAATLGASGTIATTLHRECQCGRYRHRDLLKAESIGVLRSVRSRADNIVLLLVGAGMFSLLIGLGALIGLGVMCLAAFSKKSPPCGCVQKSAPDPCSCCHGTKGNYLRTPKSVAMWALPNLVTVRDGMVAASKRNEQASIDIRLASQKGGASSVPEGRLLQRRRSRRLHCSQARPRQCRRSSGS